MSRKFSFSKKAGLLKSSAGFSLIEVMVALSLFSFSMLGMVSMQININRMIHESVQKNTVLSMAISRHEISELARTNPQSSNTLISTWEQELSKHIPYVSSHIEDDESMNVVIVWPASLQSVNNCGGELEQADSENPKNCLRL